MPPIVAFLPARGMARPTGSDAFVGECRAAASHALPIQRRHGLVQELIASHDGEGGARGRKRVNPMHCSSAGGLDDRLDVFCLTEYLADKPSRFANLGRVFARLVVAVRFGLWRPATSAVHATHGPAPNGG